MAQPVYIPLITAKQIEVAHAEDVIFVANPSAFVIEDEYWKLPL